MSGLRTVALVLLALGSLLALAGLALVFNNSSNTPPVFILMIAGGIILGFVGLITLPFSGGRVREAGAEHPAAQATQKSAGAPVISTLAVVLATVFVIAVGLVVGFFYLIHRWFGDWNLW
jgi:hypothetical protein